MIRVAIIEDQQAIRELIRMVLPNDQYTVVCESGEAYTALTEVSRNKPDLVILDIMLPDLNGLPLLKAFVRQLPKAKFLIFSGYVKENHIPKLYQQGAHGYVNKSAPLEELMEAIHTVANNGTHFPGEKLKRAKESQLGENNADLMQTLTRREREILKLIAESNTTRNIAKILGISLKTAENHRTNLMRKLDIHDVASLTRFAIEQGLVKSIPMPKMSEE